MFRNGRREEKRMEKEGTSFRIWLCYGRERSIRWSDDIFVGPLFWYQLNLGKNGGRESINYTGPSALYYKMTNMSLIILRNYKWSNI